MALVSKIMALDTYSNGSVRSQNERAKAYYDCLANCGFRWDEAAWDETTSTGILKKCTDESSFVGLRIVVNSSYVDMHAITSVIDTSAGFKENSSTVFRTASIAYDDDSLTVTLTQNTGFPNGSIANTAYLFFGKSTDRKNSSGTYMTGMCYITPNGGGNGAYLDGAHYFVDTATLIDSVHSSAACSMRTERAARYLVTRDICGFTDSVADMCRLIISDTESEPNRAEWVSLDGKMYYRNGLFLMAEEGF